MRALRLSIDPIDGDNLPLDVSDLRLHAALDGIPGTDPLLDAYLLAAIDEAEGFMHRTIVQRAHRWTLDCFPTGSDQRIRLPRGKTVSVEGITYSNNGQSTTITGLSASPVGSGFDEDLTGDDGGIVAPNFGQSWPSADFNATKPVVVTFTAGYLPGNVPAQIVQWLYFAVSDAYLHRDTGGLDSDDKRTRVMQSLLSPWILNRFV